MKESPLINTSGTTWYQHEEKYIISITHQHDKTFQISQWTNWTQSIPNGKAQSIYPTDSKRGKFMIKKPSGIIRLSEVGDMKYFKVYKGASAVVQ